MKAAILILKNGVFLVPKPQLGNASAPEAPASVRLPRQVRYQAGAWEREKPALRQNENC